MAKKNNLLGSTTPERLKDVAVGTVLAVFVFFGSFAVGDATVFLIKGDSALQASAYGCRWGIMCLDEETDESDNEDDGGSPPGSSVDAALEAAREGAEITAEDDLEKARDENDSDGWTPTSGSDYPGDEAPDGVPVDSAPPSYY
jgi:hypothetical protein